MSFDQKVVLITEGSSEIGAATAKSFAKELATVVIVGSDEDKLKDVANCLVKLNAKTLVIVADVLKNIETTQEAIIKTTIAKFGRLDVVVNNTGVLREAEFLSNNFLETYDKVIRGMRSFVRISYFAAPHLIKTQGNIVNVSSIAGSNNTISNIAYKASKAAMNEFSKSIASDLATRGVRVNTISPSLNWNVIFNGLKVDKEIYNNKTASSKLSEPNDIAEMILYIASNKAKGITGSNIWRKLQSDDYDPVGKHILT